MTPLFGACHGQAGPDIALDQEIKLDLLLRHLIGDQPVVGSLTYGEAPQEGREVHVFGTPDGHRLRGADPLVGEEQVAPGIEGRKPVRRGLDGGNESLLGLLQRRRPLLNFDLEIDGLAFRLLARLPLLGHVAHEGDAQLPSRRA